MTLDRQGRQPPTVLDDLFGRLADQKSAARDSWFASEAARDAVQLSIAAAVASSYVTLRSLDARLEVARETVRARSESLRIAKSRVGRGYSPKLELQQAQAEYDATAQIVPQIELAIARTEDGLSLLVGDTPRAIERGSALDRLAVPAVPDGLPSELLRRRPDVAQAEYQLRGAQALPAAGPADLGSGRGLFNADRRPDFDLVGRRQHPCPDLSGRQADRAG